MEKSRGIRRFILMKPNHSQKLEITNLDSQGRLVKGILFPSRFGIVECVSWVKTCENTDWNAYSFASHLDPKESLVITLIHDKKGKEESGKGGCESEGILRILISKESHTKDQKETPSLHCLPDTCLSLDREPLMQKYETKRFMGQLGPLDELISIKPILWNKYGKDPPKNVKILHLSSELHVLNALTDHHFQRCECQEKGTSEMSKMSTKTEKSVITQSTQIVEETKNQEAKKQEKKKMCIIL